MSEAFETIVKDTLGSIGELAPCPLLVTDERGLVVYASLSDALGTT